MRSFKLAACLSVLALGLTTLTTQAASAQPAPTASTPGSYIGGGFTGGVTSGGGNGEAANIGGNITGRYRFSQAPVSLRTSVLLSNGSPVVVPTVSYDLALGQRTNVYLGAGASVVTGDSDRSSPLGNQTAFALQPGVEVSLNRNLVWFGNGVVAFNAYESGGTAASLQTGVGLQF
ncbi:outer membrane beta-barrel protein [Leptolyngbya sp. FACHB-261]|uniref:outer membrane beta-barrel protein n=1 Tax=Leptolyngbya sp. FACHB-261 TaxID=2692806 RepID=UPI0016898127|nr:outer membrane beta-barrel protein [Leptolyngbya sp. FACHB-261]MBD2103639.1 porin family protein [Leptolyngbya sp. FACHB-261]